MVNCYPIEMNVRSGVLVFGGFWPLFLRVTTICLSFRRTAWPRIKSRITPARKSQWNQFIRNLHGNACNMDHVLQVGFLLTPTMNDEEDMTPHWEIATHRGQGVRSGREPAVDGFPIIPPRLQFLPSVDAGIRWDRGRSVRILNGLKE
jgi:hypothetical protein